MGPPSGCEDWQTPEAQGAPPHESPHEPQLFGSIAVLVQNIAPEASGHSVFGDWQAGAPPSMLPPPHDPLLHPSPAAQAFPQRPQFAGSLAVFTHWPFEHNIPGAGQVLPPPSPNPPPTHWPLTHEVPEGQSPSPVHPGPEPPSDEGRVPASGVLLPPQNETQAPPRHPSSSGQAEPQAPQLDGSLPVSTQFPEHSAKPAGQVGTQRFWKHRLPPGHTGPQAPLRQT